MDELVAHLVAATGLDPALARRAATIILDFLAREAPPGQAKPLTDAFGAPSGGSGGGGGIMAVFNELTAAGLGIGDIQRVAPAFIGFARQKIGSAAVDELIGSIPGLSQYV